MFKSLWYGFLWPLLYALVLLCFEPSVWGVAIVFLMSLFYWLLFVAIFYKAFKSHQKDIVVEFLSITTLQILMFLGLLAASVVYDFDFNLVLYFLGSFIGLIVLQVWALIHHLKMPQK